MCSCAEAGEEGVVGARSRVGGSTVLSWQDYAEERERPVACKMDEDLGPLLSELEPFRVAGSPAYLYYVGFRSFVRQTFAQVLSLPEEAELVEKAVSESLREFETDGHVTENGQVLLADCVEWIKAAIPTILLMAGLSMSMEENRKAAEGAAENG